MEKGGTFHSSHPENSAQNNIFRSVLEGNSTETTSKYKGYPNTSFEK
jgi:hypothetical protein